MRLNHLVAALEDDAFVDAQTRGEDVSAKDRRAMNLNAVLGADSAVHFAADDESAGFDIAVDSRAFADDQRIGSKNLSAKGSTDPYGSLEAKLSFELATVLDDSSHAGLIGWDT